MVSLLERVPKIEGNSSIFWSVLYRFGKKSWCWTMNLSWFVRFFGGGRCHQHQMTFNETFNILTISPSCRSLDSLGFCKVFFGRKLFVSFWIGSVLKTRGTFSSKKVTYLNSSFESLVSYFVDEIENFKLKFLEFSRKIWQNLDNFAWKSPSFSCFMNVFGQENCRKNVRNHKMKLDLAKRKR